LNLKLSNKENKEITFSNFNKPINLTNKTKHMQNEDTNCFILNTTQKKISPFVTYYSKKIPLKKRNNLSNSNYEIKTFNKTINKEIKKDLENINIKSKSIEKSQEKYSISYITFNLLSNQRKENSINNEKESNKKIKITLDKRILSDLKLEENNLNIIKKGKINTILDLDDYDDDGIPLIKLDDGKEDILEYDYSTKKKKRIFNNDIETTKSNSKKKSQKEKIDNNNNNIKKVIFLDEVNTFNIARNNNNNYVGTSKKKFINNIFKKMKLKTKIKLPDFSWILTQRNNTSSRKKISNNTNIKISSNDNINKIIQKKYYYNSLNNSKSKKKQNVKIINTEEINMLFRRGNNKYNTLKKPTFQQSEIYYKLSNMKKTL
jgi:hypothetical protein